MGQFRITVDAVGGHGCQRELGDGQFVPGCDKVGCPDCIAREMVRRLKRSGAQVDSAILEHWPETESTVTDDLLSGMRSGSF
jgi:hypothetical protein